MEEIKSSLKELLIGAVIGIANIIPGVSGGTMALVLGIYERLIVAVHNISFSTITNGLKILKFNKEGWQSFNNEFKRIDGLFLVKLVIGALIAIVSLAKLMTYLYSNHHDPTYGFFFGLVLVSAIVPYRLIKKKNITAVVITILAIVSVIGISESMSGDKLKGKARHKYKQELLKKQQASTTVNKKQNDSTKVDKKKYTTDISQLAFMLFLGAIAISAMILPGISGAFLMLLLGGYFEILDAISTRDWPVLIVFTVGCIFGIVVFSRLLNYLLKNWHDQTMAFLLGLVIGSLWMLWPFKTSEIIGHKPVYLANTIPAGFSVNELSTIVSIIIGIAIVGLMIRYEGKGEEVGSRQ